MLIAGMGTEVVIFVLSAFEPLHKEWDWSLAYPVLAGIPEEGEGEKSEGGEENAANATPAADPLTQRIDQMLEDAKISPELIERLGAGMSNLADSATSISNMASATAVTDKFVTTMEGAASAAGKLQNSMDGAPEAVSTLTSIYQETAKALKGSDVNYADEMKKMAASLASINSMYELQIKNSTDQLESTKEIQDRMRTMATNFADSAESVLKYKEQVDALSRKVSELNNVYGNMLAAMQTRI